MLVTTGFGECVLKGRDVRVCTIKLDQPWQGIHDAMLGVFGVEQGRALGARAS